MKTKIQSIFLATAFLMLFLGGCQEEVIEITQPQADVLNSQSPVANLVQNTTMRDGSHDNILDHSSCISVALPVTVIVNGQEVVINSEHDYKLVERIFDESDTDVDELVIVFPITVILADHTEVIVNGPDELEVLIEGCVEGGDDIDIECIDFVYPLSISIYDAANQVSDVITINNDEELFHLFESLDENELVSFNYPITLVLSDSTEVVVNNNDELEELLENVANACDEDDDDDFSDDDVDDSNLVAVLLDGHWVVTYFFGDADATAEFNGYLFTFFEHDGALVVNGDTLIEGSWKTYGDDGQLELELDFGSEPPLAEISGEWTIIEYDHTIIKLKHVTDEGHEEYLTFERYVDNGEGDEHNVTTFIVEGHWLVAKYDDSGENKTANYAGFSFTFAADSTVMATNNNETISGTWSEVKDDEMHKLVLDFGTVVPFDAFNGDWNVVEFSETRVELKDMNGGEGSTEVLVFERM
jgi:hypothetical protein